MSSSAMAGISLMLAWAVRWLTAHVHYTSPKQQTGDPALNYNVVAAFPTDKVHSRGVSAYTNIHLVYLIKCLFFYYTFLYNQYWNEFHPKYSSLIPSVLNIWITTHFVTPLHWAVCYPRLYGNTRKRKLTKLKWNEIKLYILSIQLSYIYIIITIQ